MRICDQMSATKREKKKVFRVLSLPGSHWVYVEEMAELAI